jgi:hypothetical protein
VRKSIELNSSSSGGSLKPDKTRPGHCPEPGPHLSHHRGRAIFSPKHRWLTPPPPRVNKPQEAAGNSATLRLLRRVSGSWPCDRLKEQMLGWIPRHRFQIKRSLSGGKRREGREDVPHISPSVQVLQLGYGRHGVNHYWRTLWRSPRRVKGSSGTLKPTAKGSGTVSVSAASMEAAQSRTYSEAPGDMFRATEQCAY